MKKIQIRDTIIMIIISVALVFGIGAVTAKEPISYTEGTYYAVAKGNADGLYVKVEVNSNTILSVEVIEHHETPGICEPALEQIPKNMVESQTYAVSAVSGATNTSNGIKEAVANALDQAQGKAEIVPAPAPKADPVPLSYTYKPGTYTAKAEGFEEMLEVTVVFSETEIVSVEFTSEDTPERVQAVKDALPQLIVQWQTYEVDGISGSTWTSKGVKEAVKSCVEQAKK